jgi:hypothetical protein
MNAGFDTDPCTMETTLNPAFETIVEVRCSSWGRLFDCSHAWEGEQLLGMRRPAGIRATLGTAVHASTAAFDQAKLDHSPITSSDAADVFIHTLHHPTDDVDYKQDKSITMKQAEVIGLTLHAKYCADISPLFDYKAVEMQMAPVDIDVGGGMTIRLKGTMDRARVAKAEGGIVIPDIKTGARLIEQERVILKGRAAQLGAYQVMYEENTGERTVGAQIIALQTTSATLALVSPVFDAKQSMLGTPTQKGMIEYAAGMFKSGDFLPNPQSSLCSEKFCARWNSCLFHA